MTLQCAIDIIISLATENMLSDKETQDEPELEEVRKDQEDAMVLVQHFLEGKGVDT